MRQLLNTLVFALLGAGALWARVVLHGETLNERTQILLILGALAGGMSAAILTPVFEGRRGWLWRMSAAATFTGCFMLVITALYVLEYEVLARRFLWPENVHVFGALKYATQTTGFFLAFSPAYLLPWVLPLLATLAAVLLPGIRPRKG